MLPTQLLAQTAFLPLQRRMKTRRVVELIGMIAFMGLRLSSRGNTHRFIDAGEFNDRKDLSRNVNSKNSLQ